MALVPSLVDHEPLLALFAGFGVGIVDTPSGSAPELMPQEAEQYSKAPSFTEVFLLNAD